MKIRKLSILLAISLSSIIVFTGCNKDDGPIRESIDITEIPVITTDKDASASQTITVSNQAAFAGKFKVDLYFPGATPPSKVDIVIRKNPNTSTITNANVKVYKAGVTTFPSTFTVTAAEITALFGPIAVGEVYDFAPDIYVGDRRFEAFPATGTGTGAGPRAMPFFNEFARFTAN